MFMAALSFVVTTAALSFELSWLPFFYYNHGCLFYMMNTAALSFELSQLRALSF
jgi:hypothetical protein